MMDYVAIAGRRFPAVGLICPQVEGDEVLSDEDRSLGLSPGDEAHYVPTENGLLVEVSPMGEGREHLLHLMVRARTCELFVEPIPGGQPERLWTPWLLGLLDGRLVPVPSVACGVVVPPRPTWWWANAEPEWVVEHIDRLSRMPLVPPAGPEARLVSPSEWRAAL